MLISMHTAPAILIFSRSYDINIVSGCELWYDFFLIRVHVCINVFCAVRDRLTHDNTRCVLLHNNHIQALKLFYAIHDGLTYDNGYYVLLHNKYSMCLELFLTSVVD